MNKEAVEFNTKDFAEALRQCREGNIAGNGYNLWAHGAVLKHQDEVFGRFNSSIDEINGFLVEDLKGWIEGIKDGSTPVEEAEWDLIIIGAYFVPEDNDFPPIDPDVFERLSITVKEFNDLYHSVEVRAGQEELTKCRTQNPSPRFWGLKNNLLTGRTTFEEIGTNLEEIERYASKYLFNHPYSNWDHILHPQTVNISQPEIQPLSLETSTQSPSVTPQQNVHHGEHRTVPTKNPGKTIFINPARITSH